jgi:hypothetical protein
VEFTQAEADQICEVVQAHVGAPIDGTLATEAAQLATSPPESLPSTSPPKAVFVPVESPAPEVASPDSGVSFHESLPTAPPWKGN